MYRPQRKPRSERTRVRRHRGARRLLFESLEDRRLLAAVPTLIDIVTGAGGSSPSNLTNVNGTLFFQAYDATNGSELWKSDGTTAGTALVMDINAGTGDSYPGYLTNVNGTLFFRADDGTNGYELWKSDGTTVGTALVMDINAAGDSYPGFLTNVNGTLFFQATDGSLGYELWQSDGTTAGTALVKDINAGTGSSAPKYLTNVNGTLFFRADDGSHGVELWGLVPSATAGSLDATLTGGNLTITDVFTGGKDNHLTVQFSSSNLLITDANESFTSPPAGGTLSNSNKTLSIPLSSLTGVLTINGLGGSDTLILSGGTFGVGELLSTGVGAGTLQYNSVSTVGLLTFSGLEALTDDNTVTVDYTIDGTSVADMISIANGTDSRTTVSEASHSFVPVSFKNKAFVTVNGMGGDDALTLGDNSTPASGLSNLTVDGNGGPAGHDTLTISGDFTLPSGTLELTAATLSQTAGAVSVHMLFLTGAVTQTGGTLTVGRDTIIEADTGNASLTQTGNDFTTVAAFGHDVTIVDTNDIELGMWIIDGNLDVTAGGAITVSENQEVGGTARFVTKKDGGAGIWVIGSTSTFGSVTVQTLDAAGMATANGEIVLWENEALDLASVKTTGTADISAAGPITDSGTLTIGGAVSFQTENVSGAAITLADAGSTFGSLTVRALNVAGLLAANGAISITENATLDITQIQTGAAPITLITSGDVSIPTANAVSGSGSLTIKPLATTGTVGIGASATGTLNLDATDLAGLADGFSSITIGRSDFTSGSTDVNTATFRDPVAIYGYSISVGGLSAGTNAVTLNSQGAISPHSAGSSDITGSAITLNAAGAIGNSTTSLVINASVGLTTNSNVGSANGAQYLQPNGSGTVNLTSLDAGTVTIHLTSSSGGTFQLSSSNVINDTSLVSVDGAKFDLNGKTETIGGLTLVQGEIKDSAATKGQLTSGTPFAVQQGTVSAKLAGAVGLTKSGIGTVTLSGTNVYTGTTTVGAGTLALSSGSANNLANSATLDVQSGATLDLTCLTSGELVLASGQTLHGTGTVLSKLKTPSGTTVGPGSVSGTSTGTLLQQGNFAMATGGTLEIHIGGDTAGLYDNLSVQGGVNLGGATLSLLVVNSYTVTESDQFQILTNDGTDAVTGTFAGLAEGSVITIGTLNLQISYVGGTGNDITLKKAGALIITSVTNTGPVVEHTPVSVTITAAARPDATDALTYDWDFDNNGTYEVSSSTDTAAHTYLAGGLYPVGVRIRDTNGGIGTSSTTVTVLADLVAPTSHPDLLATKQTSRTFTVTVRGSDPQPASGVNTFAIYVAVDNGPLSLYTTLTADASGLATFDYTGQDSHLYWFRSVARDRAGNTESKSPGGESSTYVPDLTAPVTQLTSVDTTQPIFQFSWSGTDSGGSGLAAVQVWGQVDAGAWTQLGQYPAGTATGGTYSGTMTYAAIVDGTMHRYAFYSVGRDGAQNTEAAPGSPDVGPLDRQFTPPAVWSVSKLTLNKNDQLQQRSYLRYADVTLNRSLGVGDSVSLKLKWLGLNGTFDGPEVSLPISGNTVGSSVVSVDFGAPGITKYASGPGGVKPIDTMLPTSSWGDGYYGLVVSVANGGDTFTQTLHFYRLLGELTGDRKVDTTDYNQVMAVRSSSTAVKRATLPTILNDDANGTGVIDGADSNAVAGARTKKAAVAASPPWTLDALELRSGPAALDTDVLPLDEQDLSLLLPAAIGRWQAAGLAAAGVRTLQQLVVRIEDVPAPALGLYGGGVLYLDRTADGRGWFVDPTPGQDEEFQPLDAGGREAAVPGGPAAGRVDLLSVLEHEFGHALGLAHRDTTGPAGELMGASLGLGERKVVTVNDVWGAGFSGTTAPPSVVTWPASPAETRPLPNANVGKDYDAYQGAADGPKESDNTAVLGRCPRLRWEQAFGQTRPDGQVLDRRHRLGTFTKNNCISGDVQGDEG